VGKKGLRLKFFIFCILATVPQLYGQANESVEKKPENSCEKNETDKEKPVEKIAEKTEEEPPAVGNFALPTSQQPAALFGFGGNIIDKGEVQLYFFADDIAGRKKIVSDLIPSILFGITDDWSIYFNFPCTPCFQDGHDISRGFEDFFVQLEYAFYNKKTACSTGQATVVGNITFPTGSIKKNPPTGFGSPSFFLGATYYHMWIDWFVFTSQGAILTTSDHRIKIGDQFLYQFGVGRNIPSPKGWIFAWMLELDGQYNKKNRFEWELDKNSGGNIIFVTPSLWVSSKHWLFQFGASGIVNQNLFGKQRKFDYALNFNCAYSFY
jgi:hypothetical protein